MRVNIYIRQEDEKAWAEIEDKPGFIHSAICNAGLFGDATPEIQKVADNEVWGEEPIPKEEPFKTYFKNKPIKTKKDIPPLKRDDPEWGGPMWKKGKK